MDRLYLGDCTGQRRVLTQWIGDPANEALEILTLKEGRYELHGCAEEKGKLTSLVRPGLEFDLAEIQ